MSFEFIQASGSTRIPAFIESEADQFQHDFNLQTNR